LHWYAYSKGSLTSLVLYGTARTFPYFAMKLIDQDQ
jgi:hypothetical protein